jgi:hypothetical protein
MLRQTQSAAQLQGEHPLVRRWNVELASSQTDPLPRGETLPGVLHSHTKPSETHLQTDQLPSYRKVGAEFAKHSTGWTTKP